MTASRALSASIQLFRSGLLAADAGCPDAELVRRFAERRDESAFAALVRRHAGVVFGVCRRVLRHQQDAEDAFQATFLVLARKANSLRRAAGVGSWLYGVAYNVARKARASRRRRSDKEREAAALHPTVHAASTPCDWQEVLDAELHGLPEKYRTPVVLCDLMGLTSAAAAAEVGCPPKTLGTRLSRGRALLAGRLTRRGVALSAVALALARSSAAEAAAPLVGPAAHAALEYASGSLAAVPFGIAALTQGVTGIMLLKSPKCVALLVCGLVVVAGLTRHATAPAQSRTAQRVASVADAPPPQEVRQAGHLDHLHRLFYHVYRQIVAAHDGFFAPEDKEEKDKKPAAPSGTWVRKEGEMKIEFVDKETVKLYPHGENEVIIISCSYSVEKEGIVKVEVTDLEGKEEAIKKAKERVPVGFKFSFRWKVKDGAATLSEVKGKDADTLKSHLEGDYAEKK
jgi:RNA polymerase sigma factor (sigma-70 family)